MGDLIKCGHYISRYLPLTEVWIHRLLVNYKKFIPILFSRNTVNLNLFPIDNIYTLNDFSFPRRIFNILFFKVFGYIPFFYLGAKSSNIDILHVHFGNHGVKCLGLRRKLGIPMLVSFYGADAFKLPLKKYYRKAFKRMFEKAEMMLVLGQYMKDELIRLGCPEEKIKIQHLGIDIKHVRFVKRIFPENKQITFLLASSFVEKKGIDIALKAFALLKNKYDFQVKIIGDGPLKNSLMKIIETNDIADRIIFFGYQPYDFFIKLCYECDIFVQASKTSSLNDKEGTPMSIVDAMATGMPVVSTWHSDIPEIVIDNQTGFLAREDDVEDFRTVIEKAINCKELNQFSINSRRHIEKEFDARKQAEKLEDIYIRLIEKQYNRDEKTS